MAHIGRRPRRHDENLDTTLAAVASEIVRTDSRASLLLAFNGAVLADLASVTDKGHLVANVVEEQERHRRQGQSTGCTSAGQAWTGAGHGVAPHGFLALVGVGGVARVQLALDPRADVAGVRELVALGWPRAVPSPRRAAHAPPLVRMRVWAGRRGKLAIGRPPWEALREAVGASERASSVAGQR
ncbi:hypothetical protein ABZ516_35605 [Streptomyces sp. NPDC019826]|uniref:hypothetical protein n=1 Tax=unclassified Streptomyces TaxID=2593676 RepID=UPI000998A008